MSNITEYVILVSVVAGACIAMQPYLKGRLQGANKSAADGYDAAVAAAGLAPGSWEPVRNSRSDTSTNQVMSDVRSGSIDVDSASSVGQQK